MFVRKILLVSFSVLFISGCNFVGQESVSDKIRVNSDENKVNGITNVVEEKKINNNANITAIEKGSFTGYFTNEKMNDNCQTEDLCFLSKDLAYFVITSSTDEKFLLETVGANKKFVMGCLENNQIIYTNYSCKDTFEGEITGVQYEKLKNSNKDNKVTIEVEKLCEPAGADALTVCNSIFRNFKIIN